MHLLRVANALDRDAFDVSLAVQRPGSYEDLVADDVRIVRTAARGPVRAILSLRALLRDCKPDVVYTCVDVASCTALLACRFTHKRPRIVVSVQNTSTMLYAPPLPWRARVIGYLARLLYPSADILVASSQGVASDLRRYLRGRGRVVVLFNAGYDDDVLAASTVALPQDVARGDVPVVVACGRLVEQKGFDDLIRAFRRVHLESGATLWIIGEGPQRGPLQLLAASLELEVAVRLLGFQDNPYRFMRAADVFVLSSRFEGFANVIVEAMACGVPVVATNCPSGPAEIIEDGKSGVLVPPGDIDALAAAILGLLGDPRRRAAIATAGRSRAEMFAAHAVVDAHAAVLQGSGCGPAA